MTDGLSSLQDRTEQFFFDSDGMTPNKIKKTKKRPEGTCLPAFRRVVEEEEEIVDGERTKVDYAL